MAVSHDLKKRFEEIIEIRNISLETVDKVAISESNILRPIKGVCFEELFCMSVANYVDKHEIESGEGDSDVDLTVKSNKLQLKTIATGYTKDKERIGVSLHKTHGNETRPHNLYKIEDRTFDFLVVMHPDNGILIVPFDDIPKNVNWNGYLADPAIFDWNTKWLNRWELIGLSDSLSGKSIENREIPDKSELPQLSKETYLEDFQIIETLCKPEYFRAAVMGLKGNLKQYWIIDELRNKGFNITEPTEAYPKYDLVINLENRKIRVQVKGTSKNMCNPDNNKIGTEVMGTHGQFPLRGYKKTDFDYLALIISEHQMNQSYPIEDGLHFIFIPMNDLPLHYLIGNGVDGRKTNWANEKWNLEDFSNVIYPNIKLITNYNSQNSKVEISPDLDTYRKYRGYDIIPDDSPFRSAGPYMLDEIPKSLNNS